MLTDFNDIWWECTVSDF